jgi:hypothetical protein
MPHKLAPLPVPDLRDASRLRPGGVRPASHLAARLDAPTLPEFNPSQVADRLHAAAVLYYAAQLDRLCLFTVADRVVRLFVDGFLPLPPGALVHAYARAQTNFPAAEERAAACAQVVGEANREAPILLDLWLVNAVAQPADPLACAVVGRALATNLARRSSPLVTRIHAHVSAAVELLSDPGVLLAFGDRDLWHLVERIAAQYLARPLDVPRLRGRAVIGSAALVWLADHAAVDDFEPDETLSHLAASWLALTH